MANSIMFAAITLDLITQHARDLLGADDGLDLARTYVPDEIINTIVGRIGRNLNHVRGENKRMRNKRVRERIREIIREASAREGIDRVQLKRDYVASKKAAKLQRARDRRQRVVRNRRPHHTDMYVG